MPNTTNNRPPTAASAAVNSNSTTPNSTQANFRLALTTISIDRVDRLPEDDFKTWAQTVVVTGSRLSSRFWFAGDEKESNLGKTSVVGGNENAPYSFARNSKDFPVDNATLSEFSSSFLQVCFLPLYSTFILFYTCDTNVTLTLLFSLSRSIFSKEVHEILQKTFGLVG